MSNAFEFEKVSVEEAFKVLEPGSRPIGDASRSYARLPEPAEPLAAETVAWLAGLAPEFAPRELASHFPRVANELCANWKRPAQCEVYLNELMLADRNGRAGFPSAVIRELGTLAAHYADLFPAHEATWSNLSKR